MTIARRLCRWLCSPTPRGGRAAWGRGSGPGIASFALLTSLTGACQQERVDATPAGVTNEFLHRMASVHGEPEDAARAFALLSPDAQKNLEERAARATQVVGRYVAAHEMLVPSHFNLAFRPESFSSEITGQWAVVTVKGSNESQTALVRCQRLDAAWRIVLDLPSLPAIERRDPRIEPSVPPKTWSDDG